jgi:hypothetical protein
MIPSILLYWLLATPPFSALPPPEWAWENRELAKTWGMYDIAVIQAKHRDIQGAKHTLSQIGDDREKAPADVTAVWFCCGRPVYDHPPAPPYRTWQYEPLFANGHQAINRTPAKNLPALPPDYLAADPRHGAIVEFTDETDSSGTRITSRRYADGSVVIETPRPYLGPAKQ